jgi:proline iminopeptidase
MTPDTASAPAAPRVLEHFMLDVGDGHQLYVETAGRPDGVPVIYLHGGPGSGAQPEHRALFDPGRFRAVLFDQRGAGRSTPHRSRVATSTNHLVADMEAIRAALGIRRWIVVGGSWGATLGLAYAERFPERVLGLVLRATFLGTRGELDWAFGEGLARFYPTLHDDFLSILPDAERADPLPNYWRRILDPDPAVHGPAARAWHDTERVLSEIHPTTTRLDLNEVRSGARLPATAFMEAHYFARDCFLDTDELVRNAGRLAGVPGRIVQSRFDLLCPPINAARLKAGWPDSQVVMVEAAGHSLGHPAVRAAVMAAVEELGAVVKSS